jgi:hypothetical protein
LRRVSGPERVLFKQEFLIPQSQGDPVKQIRKRVTYANVMSSIAVFLVLGGGAAYAAKKIGSNEIKGNSITTGKIKKEAVSASKLKKNAVTTAKIAKGAVTGSKVNLSTLGTVPNASHADNATNATNATNANNLNGLKTFSGHGADNTMTVLFSTGQFDVVGICSENEEFDPPGFQFEDVSSALGIINRGQNGGVAETFDDDDEAFEIGDGVAFDYLDAGDPGTAVLPNGHWIHVLGGTITEFSTNPNFGTGCTFHGIAFFG